MRITSLFVFFFFVLGINIPSLQAQHESKERLRKHTSPDNRAQRQVERLDKWVELNPEQEKQIKFLYLEYGKQLALIREEVRDGGDFEAFKTKQADIHAAQREDIQAILSPEQFEQMLTKEAELKAKRPDPNKPRQSSPGVLKDQKS